MAKIIDHTMITSLFIQRRHRNQSGKKLGSYKYPGAAIGIHDIMLAGKEEFGRGGFCEMCLIAAGNVVSLCLISHLT